MVIVVKVGGSLFDLPDLGRRLRAWLESRPEARFKIIPGGGPAVDVVRQWDRDHGIGERRSHWLALGVLSLNSIFLHHLLEGCRASYDVIDPHSFIAADQKHPDTLPCIWQVTSDSIAAWWARRFGAQEVVLLKSVSIPPEMSWEEAGEKGYVDPMFAGLVENASFVVRAVNLRE